MAYKIAGRIKNHTTKITSRNVSMLLCLVIVFSLSGCFGRSQPAQHLAADVILLTPGSSNKQEVLSFLGRPDQQGTTAGGDEVWLYYHADKNWLYSIPYVGSKVGSKHYDMVIVTFAGELVKNSLFRRLESKEELKTIFREIGINIREQIDTE